MFCFPFLFWLRTFSVVSHDMVLKRLNHNDILSCIHVVGPTTIEIVSRLLHIENIEEMETLCQQLKEDRMLQESVGEYKRKLVSITAFGAEVIQSLKTPPKSYELLHDTLTAKDVQMHSLKCAIEAILGDRRTRFMDVHQLHAALVARNEGAFSMSTTRSAVYSLLADETIQVCGPLLSLCTDHHGYYAQP